MSDPVRRCPDHGYTDGACPCGTVGETVLPADRRTQLSKFLSGALRHFPADAGLSLDEQGWAAWTAVIESVTERYPWADADAVAAVVATDPKGRFERDDGRIRAAYGHSVDIDLDPTDGPIPDRLYHGTSPSAADSIREEGLKPMGRQHVHLSATRDDARAVGRRHAADPVVFAVDAAALSEEYRIAKRGAETYTVDRVPPSFLTVVEG